MQRYCRKLLENAGFNTKVGYLLAEMTEDIRPTLFQLQGAVAFVLLIGCLNIANLVLVRTSGRTRELATRHAIGADRGRLAFDAEGIGRLELHPVSQFVRLDARFELRVRLPLGRVPRIEPLQQIQLRPLLGARARCLRARQLQRAIRSGSAHSGRRRSRSA